MPEIKNTFLAGKMNKDLDERLVPQGEYREALNVQVSKSEGSDVGVMHNIKGNTLFDNSQDLGTAKVLGSVFDDQNNTVYFFISNTTVKTVTSKSILSQGGNQKVYLDDISGINDGDTVFGHDLAVTVEVVSTSSSDNSATLRDVTNNLDLNTTFLKNAVLSFSQDSSKINEIRKLKIGDAQSSLIMDNDFLNFDKNNRIQANIMENYLFFTDNVNEPKKLDLTKTYNSSTQESEITVAKIAPLFAPKLASMTNNSNIEEDYLERKFARFAYRYKFEDNTYSVLSPFSIIAFDIEEGPSTYGATVMNEIAHAGLNKNIINKNNEFNFYIYTPDGYTNFDAAQIKEVEIVMKTTDSTSLYSMDVITVDNNITYTEDTSVSQFYYNFIYQSKKPKKILPESILLRVYDDVPIKALAQEIVGNRVVYGNYTKNLDLSTVSNKKLDYTVDVVSSSSTTKLGVKQYRNYDIGIVFFDEFGRTSPVILSDNSTIRVSGEADYSGLSGNKLSIQFTNSAQITDLIENTKFKYYSIVIKQTEQQYYNIYTPGIGTYLGESYFPLVADSINKIPLSVEQQASNAGIYSTEQAIYPVLINQSTFVQTSGDGLNTVVAAEGYQITNTNTNQQNINNFTSSSFQSFTTSDVTNQNIITLQDNYNDPYLGTILLTDGIGAIAYIDGIKKTVNYTSSSQEVQFTTSDLADATDIKIFLTANNVPVGGGGLQRYTYSLTVPTTASSDVTITDAGDHLSIVVGSVISTDPNDYTYIITEADSTVPSDFERLTITGIGKASDLATIPQEVLNASSEARRTGIYKANVNTTYVAVEGEYGPYYSSFNGDNNFKGLKQDLAVFETKPVESSLDIYYETATQGRLSDITINTPMEIQYYNCLNVKMFTNAYVQESRIEGGFNEPYIDNGVTGYIVDNDYAQIHRPASIIYSGIINTRTGVDNSNQFPLLGDITRSLDPSNGSIQKLYADTNDLLILQEEKVSKALIDKDIIYTAEGQGLTTAGANVISSINGYTTNYGIGKNPESFAVYAGRKYFVDKPKGVVLRLSRDGMTEISSYGMRSFFRNTLSDATDIIGMWDIYNKEYVLSVTKPSDSYTVGFDEGTNGWSSFYSYITSEAGGSIDSNFYTFKNAKIYKHYSNSDHNIFYQEQNAYDSYVEFVFNENPSVNKNFNTINYEGSDTWNIIDIVTDSDQAENIGAFNINNQDAIISAFKKVHNKYYSPVFNKTPSAPNEIVFGDDLSGIKGFFTKMKIKTNDTSYKELYSVSSNYNINSY
jgi:hypothetical protein